MNFLAHIYLSGPNELITIGNFIADGIKGKDYLEYPHDVQIGILLHREIDTFTDAHSTFRLSTKRLHKKYSHYSGVIVDILYDHFLAKNWSNYCDEPLDTYVESFYRTLNDHYEILPSRTQHLMPYMISDNWLLSYARIEGIAQALAGMNRRTKNRSGMHLAVQDLQEFYDEFEDEFTDFFTELIAFSEKKLKILSSQV